MHAPSYPLQSPLDLSLLTCQTVRALERIVLVSAAVELPKNSGQVLFLPRVSLNAVIPAAPQPLVLVRMPQSSMSMREATTANQVSIRV